MSLNRRGILRFTVSIVLCLIALSIRSGRGGAATLTFDDFISLGRVSDPQVSPDSRWVAYVVTVFDKEKNTSDSDIYIVSMEGGEARCMTRSPEKDDSPRFSPDGKTLAFRSTRGGSSQIWILPVSGGEARELTKLSTDCSSPLWTPDGRYVLFTSSVYADCPDDECNKKKKEEAEKSKVQARVYETLLYRHWDSWRDETRSHIFRIPANGGEAMDLTPGAVDYPAFAAGSDHDVAVAPDGREICVAANPGQNLERNINNDLFVLSVDGGDMRKITDNPANDNGPIYSPDGKHIAYRAMSRPGFEADRYRLMLYDRASGRSIEPSGDLAGRLDRSVDEICWAPDGRSLYVTCEDEGYVSLYRVEVKGGKVEQLTRKLLASSPSASRDGKHLVFLSQTARAPNEVFRCDRNGGKVRQISQVNKSKLPSVEMNPLEEFSFQGAAGAQVHGFLLKPPAFDASRKYPLVYLIHGGPQGAWSDGFHWRWNYQMFAAPGYVVAAVNFHGSTGYGQQFTDAITRDWGGKPYEDLMKGLDHVLATYSFLDPERVAAAGASYGGYMINWIAGHSDRFDCLVSHDGVYNFTNFYGTTEELWFPEWEFGGTPWDSPEGYTTFSPHTYAKNFKTPTLVVHGGKDYRVDPSEGLQFYTALQRQGVPSKLLYFPDEGHFVLKPQNAELWWKTVLDWLAEWLK